MLRRRRTKEEGTTAISATVFFLGKVPSSCSRSYDGRRAALRSGVSILGGTACDSLPQRSKLQPLRVLVLFAGSPRVLLPAEIEGTPEHRDKAEAAPSTRPRLIRKPSSHRSSSSPQTVRRFLANEGPRLGIHSRGLQILHQTLRVVRPIRRSDGESSCCFPPQGL